MSEQINERLLRALQGLLCHHRIMDLEQTTDTMQDRLNEARDAVAEATGVLCNSCQHFMRGWNATRRNPAEPPECAHPECGALMTATMKRHPIRRCKCYARKPSAFPYPPTTGGDQ